MTRFDWDMSNKGITKGIVAMFFAITFALAATVTWGTMKFVLVLVLGALGAMVLRRWARSG